MLALAFVQVIRVAAPGGPATVRDLSGDDSDWSPWLRWMAERRLLPLGLDCETNAVDPFDHRFRLRTVQVADGLESWVLRVEEFLRPMRVALAALLREHPLFVAHYAEVDIRLLVRGLEHAEGCGPVRVEDDSTPHVVDTQAVLAVYDPRTVTSAKGVDPRIPRPKGLKEVSRRLLGPELAEAEAAMHARFRELAPVGHRTPEKCKTWGFANVPLDDPTFLPYAGLDPLTAIRLWWLMRRELEGRGRWRRAELAMLDQWQVDLQTLRGLPVDGPYARWLAGELQGVVDARAGWLEREHGVPPSGMGPSVGSAFARLGVASPAANGTSWTKEELATVLDPERGYPEGARWLAQAVREVRRAGKFRSTYAQPMLDALGRDGALHPSSRAFGAVTSRETAQRPPVHQLPKQDTRVRAAVRAPRGWVVVTADFNQGEPFVIAAMSGDPQYLADLTQPVAALGKPDFNSVGALMVYGDEYDPRQGKVAGTPHYLMRQNFKFGHLAWCYGARPPKLARLLGRPVETGQRIEAEWIERWPLLGRRRAELNRRTYVELASGTVVPLWDRFWVHPHTGELMPRTWDDGTPRPSRLGLNADTQGTQADLLRFAKHRLRSVGLAWALRFSLHDELMLMVPEPMGEWARATLEECMTVRCLGVTVRCEATIEGRTWLDRKSVV